MVNWKRKQAVVMVTNFVRKMFGYPDFPVKRFSNLSRESNSLNAKSMGFEEKNMEETGLTRIETDHQNPMKLFHEWYAEHLQSNPPESVFKALCFSTASRDGHVSSRSLLLRRLDEDGFVIMTDNRSYKAKNLDENPYASMVFLWYKHSKALTRQVRTEGMITKLKKEETNELYENEPLFAKLRAYVCHQGEFVNWDQLKKDHDNLLQQVMSAGVSLAKPEHVVGYKLLPHFMEFYEAQGTKIADRLLFTKTENNSLPSLWEKHRLAA